MHYTAPTFTPPIHKQYTIRTTHTIRTFVGTPYGSFAKLMTNKQKNDKNDAKTIEKAELKAKSRASHVVFDHYNYPTGVYYVYVWGCVYYVCLVCVYVYIRDMYKYVFGCEVCFLGIL